VFGGGFDLVGWSLNGRRNHGLPSQATGFPFQRHGAKHRVWTTDAKVIRLLVNELDKHWIPQLEVRRGCKWQWVIHILLSRHEMDLAILADDIVIAFLCVLGEDNRTEASKE
jgi:hypothetical protein